MSDDLERAPPPAPAKPPLWRALWNEAAPAFEGLDWGSATIVVTACCSLLLARYHGGVGGYRRMFGNSLSDWPFESIYDHWFWFAASFLLYGVFPFLVLVLLPTERLREYGLGLGDWRAGTKICGVFFVFMFAVVVVMSQTGTFGNTYPLDRDALDSWAHFWLYQPGYWAYFVGWEFLFRGFLLFGLHKRIGNHAIWVQLIPFVIMHSGKPELEAFGSIVAGVALCVLALRTRSFWYGAILHSAIATSMDLVNAWSRIR